MAAGLPTRAEEVERVLALVNGVPILASDAELAEVAGLVPRLPNESEADYRRAVVEALIALELRFQDLERSRLVERLSPDLETAWHRVVANAGGEDALSAKLAASGLSEGDLRRLVRRAAAVEAYVAKRFAASLRVTGEEVEAAYREAFSSRSEASPAPPLDQVRPQLEALVREKKLLSEVERWTRELESRSEVTRYLR